MYLTKKQVTPVPKYFYGKEFIPPDTPGWYTWVLPEDTVAWSRDWKGAGSGGSSQYGGKAGSGNDSKYESQDYWQYNFGWSVKAITVYVAPGGSANGAGGTMLMYYTPYIPLPGSAPGTPNTFGSIGGSSGVDGTNTVGGSQGTQMSIDLKTVLELGAGGQTTGARGDRSCGGGRNGAGGNSWIRLYALNAADDADYRSGYQIHNFSTLTGNYFGEDIVIIKWPTTYRYFDLVFSLPGSGGQGGQAFSAGGAYASGALYTQRIDRNNCTPWGYNPKLLYIHLGRPGRGGAVGKVWGGVGTSVVAYISPTEYADDMNPYQIDLRAIPVSSSAVWASVFLNARPVDGDRTGTQNPGPQASVTFYGTTYSTGANPGQAPGRSGRGGNGGLIPSRGQDGAPGGVWWNIHN